MQISTIQTEQGETFHLRCSSVQDAIHAPIDTRNADSDLKDYTDPDIPNMLDEYGKEWYGVDTRREALDIIGGSGWAEGAQKVLSAFGQIEGAQIEAPRSIRRRKVWGADGDTCDPDRLRNGQYDTAFQSTRRASAKTAGRIVRIYSNIGANCSEDADAIFWAGAAGLFLTDCLESAGYRVELYAAGYATGTFSPGGNALTTVQIKSSDAPANADQIASILCLAGFFRTIVFRAYCAVPKLVCYHCGHSSQITGATLSAAGIYEPGDIIIPKIRNQREAEAFIRKAFRDIAAPASSEDQSEEDTERPAPVEYAPPAPVPVGPQITASGDTYTKRLTLKAAGFVWDKAGKQWTASASSADACALAKAGLPGVIFSGHEEG